MRLKNLIPRKLRLIYKLNRRNIADFISGTSFAHVKDTDKAFSYSIAETQPIRQSSHFQNKIDNIKLGTKRIEQYTIAQGETFSFWHAVGNPSPLKGFKIGRNLINGTLQADYGGGLCQLSGIVYYCALKAGLTITERYNHTIDIYTEEERFTPLGSDATVVYGYKDLRILNPYPFDVQFRFDIQDQSITCKLLSSEPISERQLDFRRKKQGAKVLVQTFSDNIHVANSEYITSDNK